MIHQKQEQSNKKAQLPPRFTEQAGPAWKNSLLLWLFLLKFLNGTKKYDQRGG